MTKSKIRVPVHSRFVISKSLADYPFHRDHCKKMQLTVLLMMASGTLGLPNRLNPFLPIHDLFSAAQIDKLNSIVDRKFDFSRPDSLFIPDYP